MISKDFKKLLNLSFLPAIFITVVLSCASALFYLAVNSLQRLQIDPLQHIALKSPMIIPQIILAVILLIVSRYKSFEKVFKGTLIALIGLTSLLTLFVFFQGNLQLQSMPAALVNIMPKHMVTLYEPHIIHWPSSLLFIVASLLSFNLFSLLIWGFINRISTVKEGIKYYITLTLVLGIVGAIIANLGFVYLGAANWSLYALIIPAIAFMIFALMIFSFAWNKLPMDLMQPKESGINRKNRFPFLSAAYLLAGCLMAKNILSTLWKFQVKSQMPSPNVYSNFFGRFSVTVAATTLIISILWVILGTWILKKKGWRTAAWSGFLSVIIGGLLFFGFSIGNSSVSWLNQGIFTGVLTTTTSGLFFPLIQILYLYLPFQNRFETKVATEMVALPLMKAIPSLMTQGLIMTFGSLSAAALYLQILVPIFMLLLYIAYKRLGSKFSDRMDFPRS